MSDSTIQQYGLTFERVLAETVACQPLVDEWDRLTGYRLRSLGRRSPIGRMVDDATGYREETMREVARDFIAFVYDCVWTRLPA